MSACCPVQMSLQLFKGTSGHAVVPVTVDVQSSAEADTDAPWCLESASGCLLTSTAAAAADMLNQAEAALTAPLPHVYAATERGDDVMPLPQVRNAVHSRCLASVPRCLHPWGDCCFLVPLEA